MSKREPLIMRHFHTGSEILQFIKDNTPGCDIPMNPLKPEKVEEVKDHLFVKHDINLFNVVIRYNKYLNENQLQIFGVENIKLDAITDSPFKLQDFEDTWHNVLDVESAIELYTPIFQLFLTDNDFWRASNSLQLDETIGVYVSNIIGDRSHMWRVVNRHPLVPLTTFKAGYRLLLHGMASEGLHYMLRSMKRQQLAAKSAV